MSCETTKSDHFLTPDYPGSHRKRTDPEIGSDPFRLWESCQNSVDPVSGYQRKTMDSIGIRQKVNDRIRFAVWQRIWNPSDRIRCTRFDLGIFIYIFTNKLVSELQTNHLFSSLWNHKKLIESDLIVVSGCSILWSIDYMLLRLILFWLTNIIFYQPDLKH
jgi:hypothetical protein